MPRRRRDSRSTNTSVSHTQTQVQQSVQFKGPLPLPSFIKEYEEACPGAADRIIKMAEQQAGHRMKLESQVIASNIRKENIGQVMAFILAMAAIVGGVFIILNDKSAEGLAVVIGALVALVGVFAYGRRAQAKERKEKNLQ